MGDSVDYWSTVDSIKIEQKLGVFRLHNDFEITVEYISSKGIPEPISSILLVGAIICLILGSGFFIFGENQKIGSVFLLLFIIPTTIIFHVFPFHQRAVFMNLALIGGLIITAIREPK